MIDNIEYFKYENESFKNKGSFFYLLSYSQDEN